MNLKSSIVLFFVLLLTHILGNRTISLSVYENIYLFKFIEVAVFLLTIFFAVQIILKLVRRK